MQNSALPKAPTAEEGFALLGLFALSLPYDDQVQCRLSPFTLGCLDMPAVVLDLCRLHLLLLPYRRFRGDPGTGAH